MKELVFSVKKSLLGCDARIRVFPAAIHQIVQICRDQEENFTLPAGILNQAAKTITASTHND